MLHGISQRIDSHYLSYSKIEQNAVDMIARDYWIGTAAEYMGKVCFLDKPLIGYRRHSSNVTQMTHGSIRFMIKKRIDIIRCLGLLKKRVRKVKA